MESDKRGETGADAALFGTLQKGSLLAPGCHLLQNFLGPENFCFLVHAYLVEIAFVNL